VFAWPPLYYSCHFVVLLLTRRPATSTLFPYTTLFRSALLGSLLSPEHTALYALLGMAAMMGGTMRSPLTATVFAFELTGNVHALDRKSTRLNSSHVKISYAVFCLKKKRMNEKRADPTT